MNIFNDVCSRALRILGGIFGFIVGLFLAGGAAVVYFFVGEFIGKRFFNFDIPYLGKTYLKDMLPLAMSASAFCLTARGVEGRFAWPVNYVIYLVAKLPALWLTLLGGPSLILFLVNFALGLLGKQIGNPNLRIEGVLAILFVFVVAATVLQIALPAIFDAPESETAAREYNPISYEEAKRRAGSRSPSPEGETQEVGERGGDAISYEEAKRRAAS